jgi:hypothetical protein
LGSVAAFRREGTFDMIATFEPTSRRFSAMLPLIGTTSAFFALLGVGFAIGGTAMMAMM